MSGHNKWSTIKARKGAADAKRGKVFTKLIREITIAARAGGGDVNANARLRTAVAAARAQNMPNDNIDRAIKKGTGELEGEIIEEMTFEGYGPGGVAIFVEATSDNKNRTTAEVRQIFSKCNGNMGASGCVGYMFKQCGQIIFDASKYTEDEMMEIALDLGADDVALDEDQIVVTTAPSSFIDVKEGFDAKKMEYISAEVTRVPDNTVRVTGKDAANNLKLVDRLEESDDVSNVYANFDIDEAELEQLQNA